MRLKVSKRALVYVRHFKACIGGVDLLALIDEDERPNWRPTEEVFPKLKAFRVARTDADKTSTIWKLLTQSLLDDF